VVGVALLGGLAAYGRVLRPWQLRWGSRPREAESPLPGDDLVLEPNVVATRAITIRVSADRVWPWIAQVGQGRGGFYSYDALENLVGCDIHSATRVVPEWQDPRVGDEVRLAPQVGLEVVAVEPGRALVLRGGVPMGSVAPPYDFTWAFILARESAAATRLIVRERYAYRRSWARLIVEPVEVISFLMSEKMLRGIRDRSERTDAG